LCIDDEVATSHVYNDINNPEIEMNMEAEQCDIEFEANFRFSLN
jgi:hypothetical protein